MDDKCINKYYQNICDNEKEYNKNYYQQTRDKRLTEISVKIMCECGCEIRKSSLVRHLKTPRHHKLMKLINNENEPNEENKAPEP